MAAIVSGGLSLVDADELADVHRAAVKRRSTPLARAGGELQLTFQRVQPKTHNR